jgi:hypothetical protein
MAADDFYTYSARQRLAQIDAAKAQSLANLAQCKATADYENAAIEVQQIANCEAEKANLIALHDQYVASQTPPAQSELSAEERASKPLHRMDWNDALELAKTSKYGKGLSWHDQNVQAGYREAVARRARGE